MNVASCFGCADATVVCFAAVGLGGWNINRKWCSPSAMVPGLVLFKVCQISWKKEQKQGFFQQIKNNLIKFHRIFVLILELISKIHVCVGGWEWNFPGFCYFWRTDFPIMSCLIDYFFSCLRWIANTSKFPTEFLAFRGAYLFKIQKSFEKRTKFVL